MIKKVFPILALSMFSSTLGIGIVSPLLPLYIKEMGATSIWLGIIVAAYFTSNSLCVPIIGRLSDRRGRKLFLTSGLLAYSIISLGYLWANNVALLLPIRLLHGVAGAMTIPVATAYIGDLSPQGQEGRWQGYASAAFFSGFGFGPLLGGVLTENFGMTTAFLTMSGLNLLAFLIAFLFLPEASRRQRERGSSRLSFKEMSTSSVVRALFSLQMALAIGSGGILAFLPIYSSMIGLSLSLIGTLLAVNTLAGTLFTPLGGRVADKLNRRTLLIITSLIFSVALVVIPQTNSFTPLLTVLLLQSLSGAVAMPAASALAVKEGRKYGMGSTMSMLFLAMHIGMAAGPIISGGIADWLNVDSVFYLGAITGLTGTVLFAWFSRGHIDKS